MMYPGTIFEYEDQSGIQALSVTEPPYKPLFMAAITSDKGPEKYTVVDGEKFFKLYGNSISFAKHGQPLLQAANIINSGGKLFVKRVVHPDSHLANITVTANLTKEQVQKTNAAGDLLYTDKTTGQETTEATDTEGAANEAIMISKCKIKYETSTVKDTKSLSEISTQVLGTIPSEPITPGEDGKYILFSIADNGRGVSNKNIQIVPDYVSSKSVDYTRYLFNVLEGNTSLESIQFGFNPDIVDYGVNVSLQSRVRTNSDQVVCYEYTDQITQMIKSIATMVGMDAEEYGLTDILFGKTKKGENLDSISVDETGVNLSHPYGLALTSGDDGKFTDRVYENEEYATEMAKVFNGEFSTEIYDLDNYKIDIILDANYPSQVKRAIEKFASFREDCFYFRDLGLFLNTLEMITNADRDSAKNKFCASYCNSYDIIDPYSRKQITVTISYSMAKLLVNHFTNGRNRPLAGQLHSMIITDAIEGTINFLPVITPDVNQKDILGDARINYVSLFDGVPVLETTYTSQEKLTQFTFSNNILAIQEVIKAIRTRCPKIRYSFIDGEDLEKYKADVQGVIDKYVNNFMSITLEYIADPVYISNKVFYAAIKVQFRNFVQTEYFKVIALPS